MQKQTVKVSERRSVRNRWNGHTGRLTPKGVITGYEVIGYLGVITVARTERRAEAIAREWEAFHAKFGLNDVGVL